jgi:nicotinamidase-related amidase
LAPPALIIIDLQNDFVALSQRIRDSIPKVRKLLEHFREKDWPVFHVIREYKADLSNVENVRRERYALGTPLVIEGTPGQQIVDDLSPLPNENVIIKPRFSAFFKTGLNTKLIEKGVGTIVVTGTVTPNCVRSTVFDGVSLDYWVIVAEDCVSSEEEGVQKANMQDLKNLGVEIVSSEEFIENWRDKEE